MNEEETKEMSVTVFFCVLSIFLSLIDSFSFHLTSIPPPLSHFLPHCSSFTFFLPHLVHFFSFLHSLLCRAHIGVWPLCVWSSSRSSGIVHRLQQTLSKQQHWLTFLNVWGNLLLISLHVFFHDFFFFYVVFEFLPFIVHFAHSMALFPSIQLAKKLQFFSMQLE